MNTYRTKKISRKLKKKMNAVVDSFFERMACEVEKHMLSRKIDALDDIFGEEGELYLGMVPANEQENREHYMRDGLNGMNRDLPLRGTRLEDDFFDFESDMSGAEDAVTDADDTNEDEEEEEEEKIPVIHIHRKRSSEEAERMERRHEVMHLPVETTHECTYEDIAARTPWHFHFMGRECVMQYKENDKSVVFVEPFTQAQAVTVLYERPTKYIQFDDDPNEVPCNIVAVLDEKYAKMFAPFDFIYRKISNVLAFAKLSEKQQAFVIKTHEKQQEQNHSDDFVPITGKLPLRSSFEICKNGLSQEKREVIKSLFEEYELIREQKSRDDILLQISYALNIDTDPREHRQLNYAEIMQIFHKNIYGMDALAEKIAEYILAYQYAGGKGNFAILLVGKPGLGKTCVCEVVAEVMDCKLGFVDCSGTNYLALNGTTKNYTAAQPGKMAKTFYEYGTTDIVMQLDEVDKLVKDRDGDAFSALIKPLGPQKKLEDKFLDFNIDVSATKFIATANHIENIPDFILDRFGNNIFFLNDYTDQDKAEIGKRYLAPKLMKEFGVKEEDLVFSDEALHLVAKEFCDDHGARKMESYIRELITKSIKFWSIGAAKKPLTVDEKFVRTHLKKTKGAKNKAGF